MNYFVRKQKNLIYFKANKFKRIFFLNKNKIKKYISFKLVSHVYSVQKCLPSSSYCLHIHISTYIRLSFLLNRLADLFKKK